MFLILVRVDGARLPHWGKNGGSLQREKRGRRLTSAELPWCCLSLLRTKHGEERRECDLPDRVVRSLPEWGKTVAAYQVTLDSLMETPPISGWVATATELAPARTQYESWLHISLALLTFVTGLVDAVGYLALGRVFTANMTGNVVLLGFAAARVPGLSIVRSMTALIFSFVGGVLAGRLEGLHRPKGRRAWLAVVGSVEIVLLVVAALVALRFPPPESLPASAVLLLIGLTAVSMGLRNGTVRHLGVLDITTTVLTLTVAGLSSESSLAGGKNPRWGRRMMAIITMLVGAFAGALLLRFSLAAVLGAASILTGAAVGIHWLRVPDVIEAPHAS
jgi:uncharacterized membrane protein YoaK (UPF0700 family)